ncbi:hypothetical protein JTB14_014113 [Gonioctena quinquepunctata]|nr:hypothetical protein JTB14_014113 [Gonioctena quinquepunctata]
MFSDFMQEECLDTGSLSETWLNQAFPSRAISVPDYNLIRKDRQGKRGGGLAFYLKKSIKYKIVDDGNAAQLQRDQRYSVPVAAGKGSSALAERAPKLIIRTSEAPS